MCENSEQQTKFENKFILISNLDNYAQDIKIIASSTLNLLQQLEETVIKISETIDNTRIDIREFQKFLESLKHQNKHSYEQFGNELYNTYIDFNTTKLEVLYNLLNDLKKIEL